MNLKEVVEYINKNYQQIDVLLREKDYVQNDFFEKPNPKYLFRGEKIYPTTKSNYHRNPITNAEQKYILNISCDLYQELNGRIDQTSTEYIPNINQIGAILQHYGFSIMWLDFTEDVRIAAFFASYKNETGKGRIWIIETKSIIENEMIFKLESNVAKRPSIQKAYALRMFDDKPDFQNPEHFNSIKIDFDLTKEDIKHFENKVLLSTSSDQISDFIIHYIENNTVDDRNLMNILLKIKNELKNNNRHTH